jgi:hypothetical protein
VASVPCAFTRFAAAVAFSFSPFFPALLSVAIPLF